MPNTSPNMNLPIPIVGVDSGPGWATDLDSSLTLVDGHDHSSGKGTPVISAGININADLPFNAQNATTIRSARFSSQGSPLALSTDKDCVYVSGVDLYYNDGNGNQIRLTQSGSISASPGNITGLVAPASAVYSAGSGTFTWQSNTNIPAKMDMASIVIREQVASPNGITIASPTSLAANYTLTLPSATPASATQYLVVDTAGNMSYVNSGTIVGSGGSFSTISAAIAATSSGGYITVLPGTYTENVSISGKNLTIVGQGHGTVINGTVTFGSGSDYSEIKLFRITGNITINTGVVEASLLEFWQASSGTITDNGTASFIQGFRE